MAEELGMVTTSRVIVVSRPRVSFDQTAAPGQEITDMSGKITCWTIKFQHHIHKVPPQHIKITALYAYSARQVINPCSKQAQLFMKNM
jgi:hypothetical protein